jgi:signal transduction histidine kinase
VRTPDREVFVEGHPVALERAVRNLVANALDAQASSTQIDQPPVELALDLEASWARLTVRDRGPGLPVGAESRIWEPDFTTKRRGTGLGLPLVRQVLEAHGGSVTAERRVGGGAEFQVLLPLMPEHDPEAEPEATK